MSDFPSERLASAATRTSPSEEIDLRQIFGALRRNYRLVSIIAGVSLVLSGLNAFYSKTSVEGEFQIVLQKQRSSTLGLRQIVSQNSMLASIIGISGNNSGSLETEIKFRKPLRTETCLQLRSGAKIRIG